MPVEDIKEAPTVGEKIVLLFWASWHESTPAMMELFHALESSIENIRFLRVEAEAVPKLSKQYSISVVPTFVMIDKNGQVIEMIEGVDDPANVTRAVMQLQNRPCLPSPPVSVGTMMTLEQEGKEKESNEEQLRKRLITLINSSEVMLFMKGIPSAPKCGFSKQIVELLQLEKISFGSFDVLSDEAVRQGLKTFSNWPTYPQLYVKGELIGGIDIVKEMIDGNNNLSLREQLNISAAPTTTTTTTARSIHDRLKVLTNQSRIMLFMKGLPSAPRCGFSRQIVEILNEQKVPFDAFDILQDNDVRQGLKEYSDWPTFPQLYVEGDFIGGLDIVKEMKQDGSLADILVTK